MSDATVIIDTGPLVASLVEGEAHHVWASLNFGGFPAPLFTSEAVITEACFLLQRKRAVEPLFALLERQVIMIAFDLQLEHKNISTLMSKYERMPNGRHMSLADATLVRLTELHDNASVFTMDTDFRIYRKHSRRQIPLIAPWNHSSN